MPATRNADIIDAIEATGVLPAAKIRSLRSIDRKMYFGLNEHERRLRRIEADHGNAELDVICRGGNRHSSEDITEIPEAAEGGGFEETLTCVRCAATNDLTKDAAGYTVRTKYTYTDRYDAIREAFTCAEAAMLLRSYRWNRYLLKVAKKCKVDPANLKLYQVGRRIVTSREHLRLLQSA